MEPEILSAMTYGAEIWSLAMVGVNKRNKIRDEDIKVRKEVKGITHKAVEEKDQ